MIKVYSKTLAFYMNYYFSRQLSEVSNNITFCICEEGLKNMNLKKGTIDSSMIHSKRNVFKSDN